MNIFKTFEIFLREPLSILKKRIIQIVNINSSLVSNASVSAEMLDDKAQITVVNSERMYNLLKTVQQRQKTLAVKRLIEATERKQVVIGQLFGRK